VRRQSVSGDGALDPPLIALSLVLLRPQGPPETVSTKAPSPLTLCGRTPKVAPAPGSDTLRMQPLAPLAHPTHWKLTKLATIPWLKR